MGQDPHFLPAWIRSIGSVAVPALVLGLPLFFLARNFRDAQAPSSAAPKLPDDLTQFLSQDHGDACTTAAQRGAAASQDFFERAQQASDWPVGIPSVTSHVLLACGQDCMTQDGETPLVERWIVGQLNPPGESLLHRGELLAVAAELRLRPAKPLMWTDESVSSIEEELDRAAAQFAVPAKEAWDERELKKGPVYGWELQAFCTYLGPSAALPDGTTVSQAALQVAQTGANTNTEAGTHDLEGLAFCAAAFEGAPFWQTQDRANYAQVSSTLQARLESDLQAMSPAGQAYVGDESFDDCPGGDATCHAMADLIKQAHFIEWAALTRPPCSPDYERALTRYAALTEQVARDWDPLDQQGWAGAMTLLSSTHAVHAGRRLAWAYEEP